MSTLDRLKTIFITDFKVALSYRFSFLSQFFTTFIQLTIFFYISKFIGVDFIKIQNESNMNYFTYVVVGLCFIDILMYLSTFASREILKHKTSGVFEEIISLPNNDIIILIGMNLYPIFISIIKLLIHFFFASFLLNDFLFKSFDIIIYSIIAVLMIISFFSISLLTMSYTITFLRVGPIPIVFIFISIFGGGAFFDVSNTPYFLETLGNLSIFKHGVEASRILAAGTQNYDYVYLLVNKMLFLSIVYFLVSMFFIYVSLNNAKKNESLLRF